MLEVLLKIKKGKSFLTKRNFSIFTLFQVKNDEFFFMVSQLDKRFIDENSAIIGRTEDAWNLKTYAMECDKVISTQKRVRPVFSGMCK